MGTTDAASGAIIRNSANGLRRLRDDEVVAVDARAVRNDEDAVGIRVGGDLQQLRQAAAPADVRLDDVATAHVDEHSESPSGCLVLSGRDQQVARRAAPDLRVAPVVVRGQELLHPLEPVGTEAFDQLQCVGDVSAIQQS